MQENWNKVGGKSKVRSVSPSLSFPTPFLSLLAKSLVCLSLLSFFSFSLFLWIKNVREVCVECKRTGIKSAGNRRFFYLCLSLSLSFSPPFLSLLAKSLLCLSLLSFFFFFLFLWSQKRKRSMRRMQENWTKVSGNTKVRFFCSSIFLWRKRKRSMRRMQR